MATTIDAAAMYERPGRVSWAWRMAIGGGYACLCVAYLVWTWSDDIGEMGGDSSMYMLMARHFSPFYPPSAVLAQATQGTVYPPLFPFLIGLLGGGMLAAHLLVAAALLSAVWCLYNWLRHEGLGRPISAWAAGVFALMPGTYFLALNVWTENPYLLLSLVAILAESRAESSGDSRSRPHWIAAAAVAAATLTRAAALPLLAAFVIRIALARPRHWLGIAASSAAPFAIWAAWSRLHQAGVSGYLAQWSSVYGQHPVAALVAQMTTEFRSLLIRWIQSWLGKNGAPVVFVYLMLAFGGICVLACLRRLFSLRFDAIYVALYLLLLLVWPFPAEASRLSYVVAPVLLVQGLLASQFQGARRDALARPVPALLLGALTLSLLPSLLLTTRRFEEPLPQSLSAARRTELYYSDDRKLSREDVQAYAGILEDLHKIDRFVPDGGCIFAIKPALVTLYANRISYLPPPASATDEAFEKAIHRCRYAYLLAYTSPSFDQTLYPLDRLGSRALPLSVVSSSEGSNVTTFAKFVEIGPRQ